MLAACQEARAPDPAEQTDIAQSTGGMPSSTTGGEAKALPDSAPAMQSPVAGGSAKADDGPAATTTLSPPVPGELGGLPDDRTPVAEGKFDAKSPQGAAARVQDYAALLEQGKYGAAYDLWGDGGKASGMSRAEFVQSFAKYSEVHAMVGAPSDPEGAAGSTYITVPLQLYGRLKAGGTFNMVGPVILRRVNDVPGATPAQLQWHIAETGLKAAGTVKESPAR